MTTIRITKTTEVPDGEYCVCRDPDMGLVEKCEYLRRTDSQVSWDSGLGSPGILSLYYCAFFDTGLRTIKTYGLVIKKLQACIASEVQQP